MNIRTLVIIPAHNEQETIAELIGEIRQIDLDLEILVVDDGSTDRTSEKASQAGAEVVRLLCRMGYGVALQTGYKYASANNYDFLVQLDADGQHNPTSIPDLLRPVISGDADITLGSRFLKPLRLKDDSSMNYHASILRTLGIRLFANLCSYFCGCRITDPTSGFQAMNRRVIRLFLQDVFPYNHPDADMILLLHRAKIRMSEYPVMMRQRKYGKSMHSGISAAWYLFEMLLSMLFSLIRKKPELI